MAAVLRDRQRTVLLLQLRQQRPQQGHHAAELVAMRGGEPGEHGLAARRQREHDAAPVGLARVALEIARLRQPVHEADGAVMADREPVGEIAHGRCVLAVETLDGKKGLVLLRGQARLARRGLAERQELAELAAELGQEAVIRRREPLRDCLSRQTGPSFLPHCFISQCDIRVPAVLNGCTLYVRRIPKTFVQRKDTLRDFTADRRLLVLTAMAVVIGTLGAASAWVLLKLIALFTNLAYLGRLSTDTVYLSRLHLTPWSISRPGHRQPRSSA